MCPLWRCMLAAICDVIKMAGGHSRGRKEQEKWYFTHSSHVVCDWNVQQATQCRGINSASVSYLSALLLTVTYEIRSGKSWITLDLLQRVVSSCCQQPSYTIFPVLPYNCEGQLKSNTTANLTACIIRIQRTRDTGH